VRTIIFDFDGTIADSFATLLGVFEDIVHRRQKLTPEEVEQLRSKKLREVIKYLKIKKWQIPGLLIKAKRAISLKIPGIKPFDGMTEVLQKLHEEGYQMFILSTNSSANVSKFLKINGLDSYFIKIYGDIGLRSKASALKKVLNKEKLTATQSLYIGDEVRDVEASDKVGIKVIAVGWGFNHPDVLRRANPTALANRPSELPGILKKIWPNSV